MKTPLALLGAILFGAFSLMAADTPAKPQPAPSPQPVPSIDPAESAGQAVPAIQPMWKADVPAALTEAEYVFTGTLDKVTAGPTAMSFPPIYNHTLEFTVDKSLRGPLKAGEKVACHHSARQEKAPVFPQGKLCLVAGKKVQGITQVDMLCEFDAARLAQVQLACAVPLGWCIEDGKAVCPWTSLGKAAWSSQMPQAQDAIVCSKTGRPALMAGAGVKFDVAPVPPAKSIQWTNPDGDGEYKITVTNSTGAPITVPALLSSGGKILWQESLVILCQGRSYPCPGCRGVTGEVSATKLEAGQSVSTVVNALALRGPDWPQGGYRIEFRFCLGEKSKTESFYYMSRHHDKLRDAAQKAALGAMDEFQLDARYAQIEEDLKPIYDKIANGRYSGAMPLFHVHRKLQAARTEIQNLAEAYNALDNSAKTDPQIRQRFFSFGHTGYAAMDSLIKMVAEQMKKEEHA